MKPLMTIFGAAALLAATAVPAVAQTDDASPTQGTLRYTPLALCDAGQPSGFDLAPCAADDAGVHIDTVAPFEITGALDGIGALTGVLTLRPDGTFGSDDAKAIFMGEVEGCGAGIVHFSLGEVEGSYDENGMPNYTQHTWEVVPGGTLPVSGSFEALGPEYLANDYSSAYDFVGELSCDDAAG